MRDAEKLGIDYDNPDAGWGDLIDPQMIHDYVWEEGDDE
jgi:hypothetical protein